MPRAAAAALHGDDPKVVKGTPVVVGVEPLGPDIDTLPTPPEAPAHFRTYEQVKQDLHKLQAKYPDLVQVKDIGDTREKQLGIADRDLWALTLTNRKAKGDKPVVLNVGTLHARETVNRPLLMKWGTDLLSRYGKDAEATHLLDTREIDIIPMANPDGHNMVERAFAGVTGGDEMHRKNTHGPGVDLNRNFDDGKWNENRESANAQKQSYGGESAASEPETKALQSYIHKRQPKSVYDWHSFTGLNMYPVSHTPEKQAMQPIQQAAVEKLSQFNHYRATGTDYLYPAAGTLDSFAWNKEGIPAFTIETGQSFHQDKDQFRETYAANAPALTYAAKAADDIYARAQGPDTSKVTVDPKNGNVTALVRESIGNFEQLGGAEFVLDPSTPVGKGTPMQLDSWMPRSYAGGRLPDKLAKDARMVYVRGQDADGNWGPLTPQWLPGREPAAAAKPARAAKKARA